MDYVKMINGLNSSLAICQPYKRLPDRQSNIKIVDRRQHRGIAKIIMS